MSSEGPVISVQGLGKQFQVQKAGESTFKGSVLSWFGRRGAREAFWALQDISFAVHRGETLGIVGANGAGKSTLLSLLARTKVPTVGTLDITGNVSSMLELGAGFHPDLTGRENVFLAGALMGLSRKRMRERFDAIVDFAELHEFIDQPVKHYSSGMYVRLGFAVATEVDPDILLLDEVLAVGDASFQRKCLDRIAEFRDERKTMLMISHDLETIKRISDRILFLDRGKVLGLGEPTGIIDQYDAASAQVSAAVTGREWGTGEITITGVTFADGEGAAESFAYGQAMKLRIAYRAREAIADPVFGFSLVGPQGQVLFGTNTQLAGLTLPRVEGEGAIEVTVGELTLGPGAYTVSVSVHSADHTVNYHRQDRFYPFIMTGDVTFEGCRMPVTWEVG